MVLLDAVFLAVVHNDVRIAFLTNHCKVMAIGHTEAVFVRYVVEVDIDILVAIAIPYFHSLVSLAHATSTPYFPNAFQQSRLGLHFPVFHGFTCFGTCVETTRGFRAKGAGPLSTKLCRCDVVNFSFGRFSCNLVETGRHIVQHVFGLFKKPRRIQNTCLVL